MKIHLFSLSGLWCDLQKILWPFLIFWDPWCLRSPVVCKKSFFWTGFHHKKLTNQKSHSTSLCIYGWPLCEKTTYSPLLCVRSKLMPCGGIHKFLWNGYSADKWRWDVGAGGVFQRALAPAMASEVVWDDTPVASLLSSRQESTKSFWLPDWKEEDIFFS